MTKTILSLDGGGVRGVVSIAFLERIEALLGEAAGRPIRLCDTFDLIGGTSTGAIIATSLALGMTATEVRDLYFTLAPSVFRRSRWRLPTLRPIFDAERLREQLIAFCGDRTLESADLHTGLAIIAKRMDTASAWFLTNNPRSKYWNDPADGSYNGNRHFRLADVIRASAAAPHYFEPQKIVIAEGAPPGLFVDGGVTAHNNPALALLEITTLPPYGYSWAIGAEELVIVSVGTGMAQKRIDAVVAGKMGTLSTALNALTGMFDEIGLQVLMLMQILGRTDTPWRINGEVGSLGGFILPKEPLFTFQRYDIRYEADWLKAELGVDVSAPDLINLRQIGNPETMPLAYEIASAAAKRFVQPEHLRLVSVRPKVDAPIVVQSSAEPVTLRLAFAGKRDLGGSTALTETALRQVFDRIAHRLGEAVQSAEVALVTGLADGGDQVAAEAFLVRPPGEKAARHLISILPFARAVYPRFSTMTDEARYARLLAASDVLELNADADVAATSGEAGRPARVAAYREQASAMLGDADILIAVDNDGRAREGGTLETTQNALAAGIPVIRLVLGDPIARVLRRPDDLAAPMTAPEASEAEIGALVERLLALRGATPRR